MSAPRRRYWFPVLLVCLTATFALSLCVGAMPLSISEVLAVLLDRGPSASHSAVVWRVRLPRALLAAVVGGGLGVAGATFQGVLRNPLADPYILGVSGGASLGAVLVLALGLGSPLSVPVAAFCGALGALAVVYGVASAHRASTHTLLLTGVMVGSFSSAALLAVLWTMPSDPMRAAFFWMAGDLSAADPELLPIALTWVAGAFLFLCWQSKALDLLSQGETAAADLGLDVGRARWWFFVAAGSITAVAVALAGMVGFVGLVVPHVARLLWGPVHRTLLPASALLGSVFLLGADSLSRVALAPAEVPVGVVTALLGAPFFLYLLRLRPVRG